MSDTTDPGGATHVGMKKMVGYPFQATRLGSGCRVSRPRLATATAATITKSATAPGPPRECDIREPHREPVLHGGYEYATARPKLRWRNSMRASTMNQRCQL